MAAPYAAVGVWLTAVAVLYGQVLWNLARQWSTDESYSHGWLVIPIAALLVWQQRDRLRTIAVRPSRVGLVIVLASLALYAAGSLAAELFTTRVSLIGLIAGTIVFVLGWPHLRAVAFPVAFLLFMIPLPATVFEELTQSLQQVASGFGENLLRAADIAVLRDGNVLILSSISLQVTEACSGIRSLVALLAATSLAAYLYEPTPIRRALLTLAAVPLAILLNGLRVAFTGIAVSWFGPAMAGGWAHELSGWVVFIASLGCVWIVHGAMAFSRHSSVISRPSSSLETA